MNIGVTGRFLSGKSTVSHLLAEMLGYSLFDSDAFVASLYKKNTIQKIIIDNFGESVYKGNTFQAKVLADIVFQSIDKLHRLESIIHPIVIEKISEIAQLGKSTVFEIPLLYEKNLHRFMDVNILVITSSEKCLERAFKRGFSREEVFIRNQFFLPDEEKIKLNPFIVDNNEGLEQLKTKVKIIADSIKQLQFNYSSGQEKGNR